MTELLWLVIPLVALIIGTLWAYAISRPPRPAAMEESMESFSRFRRALAQRSTPPRARFGVRRRRACDEADDEQPAARTH
jgi:hypothetical protein